MLDRLFNPMANASYSAKAPDMLASLFQPGLRRGTMPQERPAAAGTGLAQITPPNFEELRRRRRALMDDAFAEEEAKPALGMQDGLVMLLGALGAKLAGVKNRDISEGAAAYVGTKQGLAQERNQNIARKSDTKRRRAMADVEDIAHEIARGQRDYEYQRGRADSVADDERNHNQDLAKLTQQQQFAEKEAEKKRAASLAEKEASQYGGLLKQQDKQDKERAQGLTTESDRLTAQALIAKRNEAFFKDGPAFTDYDQAQLNELLSKSTVKQAIDENKLKWADKNAQQEFDTGVERLKQMGIVTKIREKDLETYDERQRFKRYMWYALFNQRQQNLDFNQGMKLFDQASKPQLDQIKVIEKQIDAQRKRREKLVKEAVSTIESKEDILLNIRLEDEVKRIDADIERLENAKAKQEGLMPMQPMFDDKGVYVNPYEDEFGSGPITPRGSTRLPAVNGASPATGGRTEPNKKEPFAGASAGASGKVGGKSTDPKKPEDKLKAMGGKVKG